MDPSQIAGAAAQRNSTTQTPSPENVESPSVPGTPLVSNKPLEGPGAPPPLQGDDGNKLSAIMARQRLAAEQEAKDVVSVDEFTVEEVEEVEEIVEEVEEEETEESFEEQEFVAEKASAPSGDASAATQPQGGGMIPDDDHSNSSGSIERFDKATAITSVSPPESPPKQETQQPQQVASGGASPRQQQQQQQVQPSGQQQHQEEEEQPPAEEGQGQSHRVQPYVAASPVDMQVNLDSELESESENMEEQTFEEQTVEQTEDRTEDDVDDDQSPREGDYDTAGYGAADGQTDPYDQNDQNDQNGPGYGQQPNNSYNPNTSNSSLNQRAYGQQPNNSYNPNTSNSSLNQRAYGQQHNSSFNPNNSNSSQNQGAYGQQPSNSFNLNNSSSSQNHGAYGQPPNNAFNPTNSNNSQSQGAYGQQPNNAYNRSIPNNSQSQGAYGQQSNNAYFPNNSNINQSQGAYGQQPNNAYDPYNNSGQAGRYDEYGDDDQAMGAEEFLDEGPENLNDLEQQRMMRDQHQQQQRSGGEVNYSNAYREQPPPVDPKILERRREDSEDEINCLFFVLVISCCVLIFAIGGVATILAFWLKDEDEPAVTKSAAPPTFAPVVSPTPPSPTPPSPTPPSPTPPSPTPPSPTLLPSPTLPPSPAVPTTTTNPTTSGGTPPSVPVTSSTFSLQETLTTNRDSSGFSTVAFKDGFLVLGEENFGEEKQGQVLTFLRSGGKFEALGSIASTPGLSELFGSSIDLAVVNDVPTVLIGAMRTLGANTALVSFGAATYLEYNSDSKEWEQLGGLIRGNEGVTEAKADFGAAVALASTVKRIVVAAPSSSMDQDNLDTGKVYTFGYDGEAWTIATASSYLEGGAYDWMGSSIDLTDDGSKLIVGAPGNGTGTKDGFVNYYEWSGDDWSLVSTLSGTDKEGLGQNVEFIESDGSRFAASGPQYQSGRGVVIAYIQTETDSVSFTPLGSPIVGDSGDELGRAVAGRNGRIAIGTKTTFRVYEFDNASDTWKEFGNTPDDLGSPVKDITMSDNGKIVIVGLENGEVEVFQLSDPES